MSNSDPEAYQEWNPFPKRSAPSGSGADLAARLMDDMDPEMLDFLKTTVNSFVKWDLVIFFSENPNTTDTAVNLARYIGRDVGAINAELDDLVEAGVLVQYQAGDLKIYSLTTQAPMRERLKHFVDASVDRQFRVKAIYHLIRGMR
jgi:hypothetical protein